MNRYKSLYEKTNIPLKEMANITPRFSGLSKGTIQIRPEEKHKYLPHVHFVWNVKKAENEFVKFTLSDNEDEITIIESKNMNLNNNQLKPIKKFIILNYKNLIEYYNQAEFLGTGEFFLELKQI